MEDRGASSEAVPAGARIRRVFRFARSSTEKALYSRRLLPQANLPLPHFLGLGAQKSGNVWLFENLRRHPNLYLPPAGELHYFDRHYVQTLRSYSQTFRPGFGKVFGEITPAYAILPVDRIRFIRSVMPSVKLIFLMRNPVDRAWSQALMMLVSIPNRSFADVKESEFLAHFRSPGSLRRGDYRATLENWLGIFPPEQLFIRFYEDIVRRPQQLLADVFAFLGVSRDVDWSSFPFQEVVHRGPGIRMPDRYRALLQELYREQIEVLAARFGEPVTSWRC
jgi:hypothetical protein